MESPQFLSTYDEGKAFSPSNNLTKTNTKDANTLWSFELLPLARCLLRRQFPFPEPYTNVGSGNGKLPFYARVEAESKPWPSITLQSVPSIIETTLTSFSSHTRSTGGA